MTTEIALYLVKGLGLELFIKSDPPKGVHQVTNTLTDYPHLRHDNGKRIDHHQWLSWKDLMDKSNLNMPAMPWLVIANSSARTRPACLLRKA
jgi:hypothetical protein